MSVCGKMRREGESGGVLCMDVCGEMGMTLVVNGRGQRKLNCMCVWVELGSDIGLNCMCVYGWNFEGSIGLNCVCVCMYVGVELGRQYRLNCM